MLYPNPTSLIHTYLLNILGVQIVVQKLYTHCIEVELCSLNTLQRILRLMPVILNALTVVFVGGMCRTVLSTRIQSDYYYYCVSSIVNSLIYVYKLLLSIDITRSIADSQGLLDRTQSTTLDFSTI